MWLRPSSGTLRIADGVVGRVLVFGDGPEDYGIGERHVIVPGDYPLVGFGSAPTDIGNDESVGIKVGTQVYVIEVGGNRVVVAFSAGHPVTENQ